MCSTDSGSRGRLCFCLLTKHPSAPTCCTSLPGPCSVHRRPRRLLLLPRTALTHPAVLVQVGDGVFEVLSTSGDTHLGGDDFDKRIVDYMAEDFKRAEGLDLRKDRQVLLPLC